MLWVFYLCKLKYTVNKKVKHFEVLVLNYSVILLG